MNELKVEKADFKDLEKGTGVLFEAFLNEGFTSFIFDFSKKNTKKYLFRAFLLRTKLNYFAGEQILLAKKNGKIAGICFLKRNLKIPRGLFLRTIFPDFFLILPLLFKFRFGNLIPGLKSLKLTVNIEEPYLTLEAIGVGKDYQGQGIGKILLNKTHEMAEGDPAIKGVYLFTADKKNKDIYEHFGYDIVEEKKEKGITAYHMFRTTSLRLDSDLNS